MFLIYFRRTHFAHKVVSPGKLQFFGQGMLLFPKRVYFVTFKYPSIIILLMLLLEIGLSDSCTIVRIDYPYTSGRV
jgi:hypothetical protein